MKKRLRKKKHVGEFKEFGFQVSGSLKPGLEIDAHHHFLDRLVAFVEARELCFGGGTGTDTFGVFITQSLPGSANEEDRKATEAHFAKEAAVASFTVGPLVDAWH